MATATSLSSLAVLSSTSHRYHPFARKSLTATSSFSLSRSLACAPSADLRLSHHFALFDRLSSQQREEFGVSVHMRCLGKLPGVFSGRDFFGMCYEYKNFTIRRSRLDIIEASGVAVKHGSFGCLEPGRSSGFSGQDSAGRVSIREPASENRSSAFWGGHKSIVVLPFLLTLFTLNEGRGRCLLPKLLYLFV